MQPIYADKNGKAYEGEYLWDLFNSFMADDTAPDYTDEAFTQYLADKGMRLVGLQGKSDTGMVEPMYMDEWGQVFKSSTLFSIFEMLVTDGTYQNDSLANFYHYIESEKLERIR